jgi:hypothetical protein
MSHFTTIKTQFVDARHLKQALADVRDQFGLGEVREHTTVRGFSGGTTPADLVCATRNQGYDIGFRKEGDTYNLVADWYGIRDIKQDQLTAQLQQRYAYHAVREKLDQQGFALVEEQVQQDQTIHLTLRRAV